MREVNLQTDTKRLEPCEDAISRQAAIDALKGCYCGGEDSCGEPWIYESHAIKAIKQLPPIQPEPHWITVTEEPTDRMFCYVTLKDTNDENRQNWVAEMIYTPWDGFDLMDGIEAIAWMPKQYPEPYKGVTDGRD